jgi:hypothetical protein
MRLEPPSAKQKRNCKREYEEGGINRGNLIFMENSNAREEGKSGRKAKSECIL